MEINDTGDLSPFLSRMFIPEWGFGLKKVKITHSLGYALGLPPPHSEQTFIGT
jgi:hypothetical protein